jgi:hypothetical protein
MSSSSRRSGSRREDDLPPLPVPGPSYPRLQGSGSTAKVLYTLGAEPPPEPLPPPPPTNANGRRHAPHLSLGNALAALRRPSPTPTARSVRNLRKHPGSTSDSAEAPFSESPSIQAPNLPAPNWSFSSANSSRANLAVDDVAWDPTRAPPDPARQDNDQLEAIVPWLYEVIDISVFFRRWKLRTAHFHFMCQPEPPGLSPKSVQSNFNGSLSPPPASSRGPFKISKSFGDLKGESGKRRILGLIKRKRPSKDDDSMLLLLNRVSLPKMVAGIRSVRSIESADAASLSSRRTEGSKWSLRARLKGNSLDDQSGIALDTDLDHMEGIVHPDHLAQHKRSSSQPSPDGTSYWAQSRPGSPPGQRPRRNTSLAPSDSDTVGGDRRPSVATSNLSYDSMESSTRSFWTGSTSRKASAAESYRRPSIGGSSSNYQSTSGAGPSRFASTSSAPRKGSSLSSTSPKRRSSSTYGRAASAMSGQAASGWTAPESWAVKPNQTDNPQETTSEDSEPEVGTLADYRAPDGKILPSIRGPTPTPKGDGYGSKEAMSRDISQQRPGTAGSNSTPKNVQVRSYDA